MSLAADIDLFGDSTPDGTLLVSDAGAPPIQGSPGGVGSGGSVEDNDDFRLDFHAPRQAVGLEFFSNRVDAGEQLQFRDAADQVIASFELPGLVAGSPLPEGGGFVGLHNLCGHNPHLECRRTGRQHSK